jgi:hypothetical protein
MVTKRFAVDQESARVDQQPSELAAERVDRAHQAFTESWLTRHVDPSAVEQDLDELDIAVALWLLEMHR